jgi:hypothetical protein
MATPRQGLVGHGTVFSRLTKREKNVKIVCSGYLVTAVVLPETTIGEGSCVAPLGSAADRGQRGRNFRRRDLGRNARNDSPMIPISKQTLKQTSWSWRRKDDYRRLRDCFRYLQSVRNSAQYTASFRTGTLCEFLLGEHVAFPLGLPTI